MPRGRARNRTKAPTRGWRAKRVRGGCAAKDVKCHRAAVKSLLEQSEKNQKRNRLYAARQTEQRK
eukprot:4722816-Prymnesium_polylepis.1